MRALGPACVETCSSAKLMLISGGQDEAFR
jgi:hypothetical protein